MQQDATRRPFYDVVIVGGGIMGAATGWHLLEAEPTLTVAIIEPDPSYAGAASLAANGGIRQLFSRPENVLMSRYTHEVIARWTDWPPQDGHSASEGAPDLAWNSNGYLFITAPDLSDQLEADYELQRDLGVTSLWLEPYELAERYPLIDASNLGPAILSTEDGWLAPSAFLDGMMRRARHLGASVVQDRVVGFERDGNSLTGVLLESGAAVGGDRVVNVAGVWGPELSAGLGLHLPVEPMRRFDHYVESPIDFSAYPFVKDPAGLAVRPEGLGMTAALVDFSSASGWDLSIDKTWFETVVWPAMVDRFPLTDELRLVSTWSGHYDQNRLDGQMILDRWKAELGNYYFATGFSGHGLMHAPAVGRALTELILHGEFKTLDLSRLGLARVVAGEPYRELTVR